MKSGSRTAAIWLSLIGMGICFFVPLSSLWIYDYTFLDCLEMIAAGELHYPALILIAVMSCFLISLIGAGKNYRSCVLAMSIVGISALMICLLVSDNALATGGWLSLALLIANCIISAAGKDSRVDKEEAKESDDFQYALCPYCGNNNNVRVSNFCWSCGKKIELESKKKAELVSLTELNILSSKKIEFIETLVSDKFGHTYNGGMSFFANTESYASFSLDKRFSSFNATAFVPAFVGAGRLITLKIYLDNEIAYDSKEFSSDREPFDFSLNVKGKTIMSIHVASSISFFAPVHLFLTDTELI